jgi:hypothetical protein
MGKGKAGAKNRQANKEMNVLNCGEKRQPFNHHLARYQTKDMSNIY